MQYRQDLGRSVRRKTEVRAAVKSLPAMSAIQAAIVTSGIAAALCSLALGGLL